MGVIESEEAAKRLARVIVSDIEIYNKDKFYTGADLTNAIEEGRALFRSRVAPELLPLFTSVLEDRRASRKRAESRTESKADASPAPAPQPAPAAQAVKEAAPRPAETPVAAEPIAHAAPPAMEAPAPAPTLATAAPAATPAPAVTPAPAPAVAAAPAATPAAAPASIAATPAPVPAAAAARTSPARGGIIDTEEAAARLARVIISDIELYNAKKIAAGGDLTREIDEGRSLFKSRVSGELLAIFENALATKGLGRRKRAPTPAPVPRAKPAVVEAPEPTPPVAVTPSRPPATAPSRPQVSAAKAPPAPQPRPGIASVPRPSAAPHAVGDNGSARHQIAAFSAAPAATPTPMIDRGSARHTVPPPGRAAPPSYTPEPSLDDDRATPMPGGYDDVASEPIAAVVAMSTAAPATSRPPATPPPVPARASAPSMRAVSASPPVRRERTPSVPEFPVHLDSGPIRHDESLPGRPSQAVIDALPDPDAREPIPAAAVAAAPPPVELPPVPVAPAAPTVQPAPATQPAAAPRVRTPAAMPMPAAVQIAFAPPPDASSDGEVVSLRRRMSPVRVMLTLATLAGAGGAIWYFLLR